MAKQYRLPASTDEATPSSPVVAAAIGGGVTYPKTPLKPFQPFQTVPRSARVTKTGHKYYVTEWGAVPALSARAKEECSR